jgi:3-deoxy-manno-octulosonate cytidylyltransferase (CMP-KDO synthetase)
MDQQVTVIVPARLASTRLPRKVLLDRTGLPMVQHVVQAAQGARCAAQVVVATDSAEVQRALAPYGTRVVLTSPDHPNGTSRLAEAADLLGLADDALIVNAQGDEPEMPGSVIDAAVGALLGVPGADIGTACTPFAPREDPANPNMVKCVRGVSQGGDGSSGGYARALYFTRSLAPYPRDAAAGGPGAVPVRHVGVYAYRAGFLRRYVAMPSTALERCESLEQLRALEHGCVIAVAFAPQACGLAGIDTPEQYGAFVERWLRR